MKTELITKDYFEKQSGKMKYLYFKNESELNKYMSEYYGKSIVAVATKTLSLANVTIDAWTMFFIPFATEGDAIAIAMHPNLEKFYILGHTSNTWRVKKVI